MTRRLATAAALAALLTAFVIAGCSRAPATPLTLDDVVSERIAVIEASERQRFDEFVEQSSGRLDELGLPVPQFQGVIALDDIDAVVTQCIVEVHPRLRVSRLEGGFTVSSEGPVGESFDRVRWTIDSCNAQYGIVDLRAAATPGAIEAAWRYQDATQRVMPCLRGMGVAVPTPPPLATFADHLGTPLEFNPYALGAADPATLARALALCPPTATLLQTHLRSAPVDTIEAP